jgi:hypothetical protein
MVFWKEFALVILRAKAKFHPLVDQWLEAFVYFFSFPSVPFMFLELCFAGLAFLIKFQ